MKTFAKLAAAALIASAPLAVSAQEAQTADPFVATQASAIPALAIIGGMAVILTVAAADGTN